MDVKLFNKWGFEDVEVKDPGLKPYVNLKPVLVPLSSGKHSSRQFHKSKMNIIERFANKMAVPGHRGKKHHITSKKNTGKAGTQMRTIKGVLEKLEKMTKENPLKVFVGAIENAALREEVTSYQIGGIIVRKAVVTSPQRRVDKALTIITQSAYRNSFGKKQGVVDALTNEIFHAWKNDGQKSEVIKEKERIEREASASR